eukprot:4083329-Pyramimonas_sp.AAC.1
MTRTANPAWMLFGKNKYPIELSFRRRAGIKSKMGAKLGAGGKPSTLFFFAGVRGLQGAVRSAARLGA